MTPSPAHFLDYIFANIRSKADQPLISEKQGAIYHRVTTREAAARIADVARALHLIAVGPGDRVLFYAAASPSLLIGEWAVLASRGVATIVPRSFSPEDLCEVLQESKSKLAVVDRLATAYHLAKAGLPDLKAIVCFEGAAQAELPVWSWGEFIDSARMEPDRSAASLNTIAGKDTALMFYYKDAKGAKQATRYTHALLLDHIGRIQTMLGAAAMHKGEMAMTATSWEQPIGHIAACYVPVPKEVVIQITHGIPDVSLFDNGPQVVVGDAAFFDGIRKNIEQLMRQSGQIETWMLAKAVALSRQSYESKDRIPLRLRLQKAFLQATIVKRITKMLGGNLRLFIGTDNKAHYETQLFFHTFGVELVELPEEAFK